MRKKSDPLASKGFGLTMEQAPVNLFDRFLIPPFSVLNTHSGKWQARKKQWLSLGIKSELGRSENLMISNQKELLSIQVGSRRQRFIKRKTSPDRINLKRIQGMDKGYTSGTSVFDPVLCELIYRWFCPENGKVLDPFAGGSVRGITAAWLNRKYIGIDLSKEQVNSNKEQWIAIEGKAFYVKRPRPLWLVGDAKDVQIIARARDKVKYDLIFSCPPYGNLETYSDNPADLSNFKDEDFDKAYAEIIFNACQMLKENRFACFVVGDYRNTEGFYRNLPTKTILNFQNAGLRLYNEIILMTAIGTLPIRINKQFTRGRKVGKMHQNILIFFKGNPKEISNDFKIDVGLGIPEETNEK